MVLPFYPRNNGIAAGEMQCPDARAGANELTPQVLRLGDYSGSPTGVDDREEDMPVLGMLDNDECEWYELSLDETPQVTVHFDGSVKAMASWH
jgi:hypothetical protein